ncbi:MAG: hypothetical protein ACKO6N_27440 [Myxococcota bacterium]
MPSAFPIHQFSVHRFSAHRFIAHRFIAHQCSPPSAAASARLTLTSV